MVLQEDFWCPSRSGVGGTWHPLIPDPAPWDAGRSSGIVTQPLMSRFPSCTAKPALLMFCLPWSSGGQVGAPGNQREKKQHLGPG